MRAAITCLLMAACGARKPPALPKAFSADLEVTAHLVDRSKDYPPWLRVIDVKYDFVNQRASAADLDRLFRVPSTADLHEPERVSLRGSVPAHR